MSRRAGMVDAGALAEGARPTFHHIIAGVLVATWAIVAFAFHDPLYDTLAVVASIGILGASAAFFVWRPPAGREAFRLLGFFVCGQAFLSCGMGVLLGEDEELLNIVPTTEAFSFAVQSGVVFAAVFLIGAYITAPRRVDAEPPTEVPPGPTPLTAMALAVIVSIYSVALATGVGTNALQSAGMVPIVLFNPELIFPLLMATRLLTPKKMFAPLIVALASQLFVTFISSMLGIALLAIRDALLANVLLHKKLPVRWMAVVVTAFVLLNPVKHAYRQLVLDYDAQVDSSTALSFWNEAIATSWEERPRRENRPGVDSSVKRLNYNAMSAHVYTMLESRLPFEGGSTYEDIPTLLVPRAIYPDKPTTTYMRGRWLIKLGLQDRESVERTSFAVPASAEAYWNFGWLGVVGIPFVLGLLVGLILHLAPRDAVAKTAFTVLAVVVLGQFLDMLIWVIPKFFAVLAAAPLVRLYTRLGKPRAARIRQSQSEEPAGAS